jgi:hypothetical protein
MSDVHDKSFEEQKSRVELGNEASNELDLTEYGYVANQDDEANTSGQQDVANADEINEDVLLVTEERATGNAANKKSKITKNHIAIGMVVFIGLLVGYPILSNMLENSGTSETTGAVFVEEATAKAVSTPNQYAEPNGFGQTQSASFDYDGVKSDLVKVRESSDKAFSLISQNLKAKDTIIEELTQKHAELEVTLNKLTEVGSNQLVGQTQKLTQQDNAYKSLLARVQALESRNKKYEYKEKQEKEELVAKALRAKYEIISVIPGKAIIRNTNDGNEMNIVVGDAMQGFGRIKKIAITGCITFDNDEIYEPIGATCRNI